MKIRCPNCQEIFEADSRQESLINTVVKNNQKLVFIECSVCYKDVPINPNNLLSKEPQKDENMKGENTEMIECPICQEGVVGYIDNGDEKFWGCGECGNVWYSREALNKSILKKS
jgi:rubrerythrin